MTKLDINNLEAAGLTNFEIAAIMAQRSLIDEKNTREIGKSRQHSSERLVQNYLNENWRKVYRQEELKNMEGIDHDHNESGFDLLEPISGLKIQVKYRGGSNIHLEQTRRTSTKNLGKASESGHVVYSSGEFDVLLAIRPTEFRYDFQPEKDLVIIPEHELHDSKNPGFLAKSVGRLKERELRSKYKNIVDVLNDLIKKEEV
jgi:hypothetical protein